jgi:hypothetical protein
MIWLCSFGVVVMPLFLWIAFEMKRLWLLCLLLMVWYGLGLWLAWLLVARLFPRRKETDYLLRAPSLFRRGGRGGMNEGPIGPKPSVEPTGQGKRP